MAKKRITKKQKAPRFIGPTSELADIEMDPEPVSNKKKTKKKR